MQCHVVWTIVVADKVEIWISGHICKTALGAHRPAHAWTVQMTLM